MKAELITTGTELLLGEIVDTNAAYIARQLREAGVNLYYKTTVGDNRQRLVEVLRLGLSRSDVILVTGGLGPTVDDITREAVAEATSRSLEQRPEIVERLQAQFAAWGRPLGENNLRQSFVPAGARILENPIGTAPGFLVESGNRAVLCMPGVPREMMRMMADHVLPYLQERSGSERGVIVTRVLHTAGIGESAIDDRIGEFMKAGNPTVGLSAHLGRADVRLAARAANVGAAQALLAPLEKEIRQRLQPWVYGMDDETLDGVVAALLRARHARLALIETNTSGRVAAAFSQANRDVLASTMQVMTVVELAKALGLEAVVAPDEAAAGAAAAALRAQAGAAYAIALLGSDGLDQGFWSANRGETWLGLATPSGISTQRFSVGGSDEFTGQWLAVYTLNTLRRHLLSET